MITDKNKNSEYLYIINAFSLFFTFICQPKSPSLILQMDSYDHLIY